MLFVRMISKSAPPSGNRYSPGFIVMLALVRAKTPFCRENLKKKERILIFDREKSIKSINRLTQSIMYVPLQRYIDLRKVFYLSFSTNIENLVLEILIFQNLILRTRSCDTGFITQSSWGFHFHKVEICLVEMFEFIRGVQKLAGWVIVF